MFLAALRPFRMAISTVPSTSCTKRNAVVSSRNWLCKQVWPFASGKNILYFVRRLDPCSSPISFFPTPRRRGRPAAAPAPAPPTAEQSLLYVRIGISVLCFCASIFFLSLVFFVRRLFSTITKLNATIDTINEELPGVAASVRLTSLEMADCILEFASLGRDVSGGIRAGGRALKTTEESLQESGAALKSVWANYIKPGIKERVKASKGIWDHTLEANAGLDRDPTAAEVAAVTKMSIAELRQSLAAISALQQIAVQGIRVMSSVQQTSAQDVTGDGAARKEDAWQDGSPADEADIARPENVLKTRTAFPEESVDSILPAQNATRVPNQQACDDKSAGDAGSSKASSETEHRSTDDGPG